MSCRASWLDGGAQILEAQSTQRWRAAAEFCENVTKTPCTTRVIRGAAHHHLHIIICSSLPHPLRSSVMLCVSCSTPPPLALSSTSAACARITCSTAACATRIRAVAARARARVAAAEVPQQHAARAAAVLLLPAFHLGRSPALCRQQTPRQPQRGAQGHSTYHEALLQRLRVPAVDTPSWA